MITTKHYPLNEWAPYTYPPPAGSEYSVLTKTGIRFSVDIHIDEYTDRIAIKVKSYPSPKMVKKEVEMWARISDFVKGNDLTVAYTSVEAALRWTGTRDSLVKLTGSIEVEEDE